MGGSQPRYSLPGALLLPRSFSAGALTPGHTSPRGSSRSQQVLLLLAILVGLLVISNITQVWRYHPWLALHHPAGPREVVSFSSTLKVYEQFDQLRHAKAAAAAAAAAAAGMPFRLAANAGKQGERKVPADERGVVGKPTGSNIAEDIDSQQSGDGVTVQPSKGNPTASDALTIRSHSEATLDQLRASVARLAAPPPAPPATAVVVGGVKAGAAAVAKPNGTTTAAAGQQPGAQSATQQAGSGLATADSSSSQGAAHGANGGSRSTPAEPAGAQHSSGTPPTMQPPASTDGTPEAAAAAATVAGQDTQKAATANASAAAVSDSAKAAMACPPTAAVHGVSPPVVPRVAGVPDSMYQYIASTAAAAAGVTANGTAAAAGRAPVALKHPLWWFGPVWSGSGYGSEAVNYMLSLLRTGRLAPQHLWVSHHGDEQRDSVVATMAPPDKVELQAMTAMPELLGKQTGAIVVCHSMPTNWPWPTPMWYSGARCPPHEEEAGWVYVVGRTMFETDRLPRAFVPRINAMNEVWVPSPWQAASFIASGVDPNKVRVVPEGVNTTLYDPTLYQPLALDQTAELVFGRSWADKTLSRQQQQQRQQEQEQVSGAADQLQQGGAQGVAEASVGAAAPQQQAAGDSMQQTSGGNPVAAGRSLHQQQKQPGDTPPPSPAAAAAGIPSQPTAAKASTAPPPPPAAAGQASGGGTTGLPPPSRRPFVFLSTFKWERRKGWDVLLEAYLSEFTPEDDVELFILTKPYGRSGSGFQDMMQDWARDKLGGAGQAQGRGGRQLMEHAVDQWHQQQEIGDAGLAGAAATADNPLDVAHWGLGGGPGRSDLGLGAGSSTANSSSTSADDPGRSSSNTSSGNSNTVSAEQQVVHIRHWLSSDLLPRLQAAGAVPPHWLSRALEPAPSPVHTTRQQDGTMGGDIGEHPTMAAGRVSASRHLLQHPAEDAESASAQDDSAAQEAEEGGPQVRQVADTTAAAALPVASDTSVTVREQEGVPDAHESDTETVGVANGTTTTSTSSSSSADAAVPSVATLTPSGAVLVTAGGDASGVLTEAPQGSGPPSATTTAAPAGPEFPTLYVVHRHISDEDFPRIYKAADAFVLPSRGEGWGRPHVEAMSMGLPVIATNWSGVTAYLDESVGYPLPIEDVVPVQAHADSEWWFRGLRWAQPSVKEVRRLMRHVYENREEAAAKGAAARRRMVDKYSPPAIAEAVLKEVQRIERLLG